MNGMCEQTVTGTVTVGVYCAPTPSTNLALKIHDTISIKVGWGGVPTKATNVTVAVNIGGSTTEVGSDGRLTLLAVVLNFIKAKVTREHQLQDGILLAGHNLLVLLVDMVDACALAMDSIVGIL